MRAPFPTVDVKHAKLPHIMRRLVSLISAHATTYEWSGMTRRRLALLILLFAVSPAAAAPERDGCYDIDDHAQKFTICSFDPKAFDVRLYLKGADGRPLLTLLALAAETKDGGPMVMAMNGGMYRPDFEPVGLYIADAKKLNDLSRSKGGGNFGLLPNGVFHISGGRAAVSETGAFLRQAPRPDFATQSGPMLVIDNAIHPKFSPHGTSRHIRNGVGVRADGRMIFAISAGPVTFYEFAGLFRGALQCPDALYLDGSVSSLYAPALNRMDIRAPLGPMIGVFEKTKAAR